MVFFYATDIINFVIITAVLSVANSGLYATSRMLWSMSNQGMISPIFGKLSKNGVPIYALIVSTIVGCLSLLSGIYAEDTVYLWSLIAGFGAILVWASIALSNLLARRSYIKQGGDVKDLKFKNTAVSIRTTACVSIKCNSNRWHGLYSRTKNGIVLWYSIYDCLFTVLSCYKK